MMHQLPPETVLAPEYRYNLNAVHLLPLRWYILYSKTIRRYTYDLRYNDFSPKAVHHEPKTVLCLVPLET